MPPVPKPYNQKSREREESLSKYLAETGQEQKNEVLMAEKSLEEVTVTPKSEVPATPKSDLPPTPQSEVSLTPKSEVTMTPKSEITATPKSEVSMTPKSEAPVEKPI